jgi:Tfp pilus assembly protein FimV
MAACLPGGYTRVTRRLVTSALATCMLATTVLALPALGHAAPSATSPAPDAAPAPSPVLRSYLPKPSETLDQVIAKTLPGSPLKIELLRQAFVAQNPQAFAPGKVPKPRKGMLLLVPDHGELLRSYLGRREPVADTAPVARFTPSTSEERKRWVQFP